MVGADEYQWKEELHTWWWRVTHFNDFDNAALSRAVQCPRGQVKLVMCSECLYGPFGYQEQPDGPGVCMCLQVCKVVVRVWLCSLQDFLYILAPLLNVSARSMCAC
jgi:hypothetical protein